MVNYNQANFMIHLKTHNFNRVSVIFQNLYSKQEKMGDSNPGDFPTQNCSLNFYVMLTVLSHFCAGG